MEGNIVFRQGERTIYADRMYYDVPNHVGTVLNADVLTPVRTYEGLLRLHADVVQQTAPDRFFAQNGFFTSSRMGEPGYRLQSSDIYFEDVQQPMIDPYTGQPVVDPCTGQPVVDHQRLATAVKRLLFVGPVPVFYWPTIATDLNDPTYYIRRVQLKQDSVFGTQIADQMGRLPIVGHPQQAEGHRFRHRPRLPEQARLRLRRHVQLRPPGHVRHSRPRGRPGRFLGHSGPGRRQPRPVPHGRSARGKLPLSPLLAAPRNAPLRSPAQRGTRLDQRPELRRGILQERVGRTEGREHRRGTEAASPKTARGASRPTTASTTSSRRPIGCRGATTSGWGNRCSATSSPGTSIPAPATRNSIARPCRKTSPSAPVRCAAGPFNYLPWEHRRRRAGGSPRGKRLDWPFQLGVGQGGALRPGRGGLLGRRHHTATRSTGCSGRRACGRACPCGRSTPPSAANCSTFTASPTRSTSSRVLPTPSRTRTWKTCRSTIRWTTTRSRRFGDGF